MRECLNSRQGAGVARAEVPGEWRDPITTHGAPHPRRESTPTPNIGCLSAPCARKTHQREGQRERGEIGIGTRLQRARGAGRPRESTRVPIPISL